MNSTQKGLKNYFLQIKRSPLLSGNKMKKKIKRVKSVNALREKNWDDRFIYDKIPFYDSKNDKNVLINLRSKCNSSNRKYGNVKGLSFADNSLFLYRPLSNKTTINHLFLHNKNAIKLASAKSRDINFRNDQNKLGSNYRSFLALGSNYTNNYENYKKSEIKNSIETHNFNGLNLINLNNLMKMWDELAVNKNYRKLFTVIYRELDEENKEELYEREKKELNKIKDYINNFKKTVENRINTIQELFELNIKLNTEIINKDNKSNELILGQISDKINQLREDTIKVCKSMQQLKTELSGIKNLDKFDIRLIGEKFGFDKNYLIKMKGELNFLKEGFAKYYFNLGNDQTPFLLKASEKSKISLDKDPFIHLVPLSQELKDKITECTYYIYQELIAYQNEKVHNRVLRSISPLKRIVKNCTEDEAKNLGDKEDNNEQKNLNNKINILLNKHNKTNNYINMSEDNINNKFNTLQINNKTNNKILNNINHDSNNNLYFRKNILINKNKLKEECNNKIMNDLKNNIDNHYNKENEIKKVELNEEIKNIIKNNATESNKLKSKSNNDILDLTQKEKGNLSESLGTKKSYDYKNLFSKYRINDNPINKMPINNHKENKEINLLENLNSQKEQIPNILPANNSNNNDNENKNVNDINNINNNNENNEEEKKNSDSDLEDLLS